MSGVDTPAEMFAASIDAKISARLENLHVSMPGRIESYDAAKQKANVQPLVKRQFVDERGELVSESYPVLTDVPVEFFGGGDYALAFPVERGMTCRLEFCSASISKFLLVGAEVDPKDQRRFNLTDAVCVLGLRDFAHAIRNLPAGAWVMLCPASSQIRLGSVDAAQKAVRGDAFKTALDTLIAAIATAVGGIAGGGAAAATAITSAKTAFDSASASWLSEQLRIK